MRKKLLYLILIAFPLYAQTESSEIRRVPFVFTIRPEFQFIERDVQALGGNVGLGFLSQGGFYFVLEARGGENYLGGDLNIGGLVASSRNPGVKNVFGISGGFEQMDIIVRVHDERNFFLGEIIEENFSLGGVFWKLMLGDGRRGNNFDITNKLLLGYRNEHIRYLREEGTNNVSAQTQRRLRKAYSLSVGYTFAARQRRQRRTENPIIAVPTVQELPQEEQVEDWDWGWNWETPQNIDIWNWETEEEEVPVKEELPPQEPATIALFSEVILFEPGSASLSAQAQSALFEILMTLIINPDRTLEIFGHTDDTGIPEANIILSQDRARNTANYFMDRGISRDRLRLKAFGQEKPAADNETEEGRAQNRRAEIRVLTKASD